VESAADADPELVFQVRAALVEAEFYAGLGVRLDRLDGLSAEQTPRFPPVRTASHGDDLTGRLLMYDGRVDEGRDLLRGMYDRASAENRSILPTILGWMAEGQLLAGRFEEARALTQEALDRTAEVGGAGGLPWELGFHSVALARLGLVADAEANARGVLDSTQGLDAMPALLALAIAAASREDHDEALTHLRALERAKTEAGIREPRVCAHAADLLDALLATGHVDEAAQTVATLVDQAASSESSWTAAAAAYGESLVQAAQSELDAALSAAERAEQLWAQFPAPFERARALLLKGQLLRRRREKARARSTLDEASAVFEQLGAVVWSERVRRELARIPGGRSEGVLTATEERVARLAAEGLTNREIAERTFLNHKTVEVNLTRVYRKLGVRRAALAATLAQAEGDHTTA
jgi:DNA-binding CsgD family transcriptional regulator